jgi:acyl carrier protein
MAESYQEIESTILAMVREVIGEEMADLLDLTATSTFAGDLEMDSIQVVAIAQKVQERYGGQFDLMDWLTHQSMRKLLKLNTAELATVIAE